MQAVSSVTQILLMSSFIYVGQEEAGEEVLEVHSVAADDSQTQCALSGVLSAEFSTAALLMTRVIWLQKCSARHSMEPSR